MTITPPEPTPERAELIAALAKHGRFLRQTVENLTDEQITQRTTASELCLGGVLKHVASVQEGWLDFIEKGPGAIDMTGPAAMEDHANSFKVAPEETLASLLDRYGQVEARAATLIADLPSLDMSHPLPSAPWFEPGARWSARTVVLHILTETAHHCGHADIIREALDGAKTMG